jgi:uncharacterized protein (TIGR00288 family)
MSIRIEQSVAILVDGNNIERSLHNLMDGDNVLVDFDNLVPRILGNRGLNRLAYFREGTKISEKLAERLHSHFHGIVVPCHKSADVPLTIFATQIAEKVDTVVIMSGDADYVHLVQYLKSRGVRVEIAAVEATTSSMLKDAADYFLPLVSEDLYVLKKKTQVRHKPTVKQTKNQTNEHE